MEVRYPPLKRGISAIPARYPMKTRQMGAIPPSAILSRKGIARYGGGISHWAAKGAVSTGGSPLDFFLCFFLQCLRAISKTSPLKSGESSEKSSGENRVKSCHVCGCHGFFRP